MLEVNDFNAIRISLASPEQIRGWSYGEVTKPETINYRTLRPEKDGLFCERIFGPTKDWECYCGKYKRVRYKGIICDKCGVEVARAKVRRERMAHIELASPVSHIWYFKGTPSRLSLLLDISPRNLEKILYFAQYIIYEVNEPERKKALAKLQEEEGSRIAKLDRDLRGAIAELTNPGTAEAAPSRAAVRELRVQHFEGQRTTDIEATMEQGTSLEKHLQELKGSPAPEDIVMPWTDEVLVAAGEIVRSEHIERLRQEAERRVEAIEAAFQRELDKLNTSEEIEAQVGAVTPNVQAEIDALRATYERDVKAVRDDVAKRREDLESIKLFDLPSEARVRELQEHYGHIFKAGMGAEALRTLIINLDLDALALEMRNEIHGQAASSMRRKKATKRLRVIEAFRKGPRPEWMILTVLPVIPPDLRPMVQLDGGRFATSDLNDLYRRVINRNNRLKRLLELNAPEIIVRNEKRMLQEACDALIDNGRRGRAVSGSGNHKLKSLSDMLKGKQGRFRQNLLGKRVDYSGRSVIVVGPELKLNQCGLPKRMALELFKPFVMRKLVERGFAHNIRSAKRVIERVRPEVWDVLEEVIRDHPVLLNRAPTLHRLGIQAFDAILVEGSAIQIHPLVCSAFNADFDGDQMAVHIPLSRAAQMEARTLMLSSRNLLSPADGEPVIMPTKDMVLGCYYLTMDTLPDKGAGLVFSDFYDVLHAHDAGQVGLHATISVLIPLRDLPTRQENGTLVVDREELEQPTTFIDTPMGRLRGKTLEPLPKGKAMVFKTTPGRIIFNEVLPRTLEFKNYTMDKGKLRDVVSECYREFGPAKTAQLADDIKRLGFQYATKSATTMAVDDVTIPAKKAEILAETQKRADELDKQFRRGLITAAERKQQRIQAWQEATRRVADEVTKSLDHNGSIFVMATSGAAKGQFTQISQLAGMRGLMAAPSGETIDLPIRSNFREGLSVLEYFISTHGARKGLADTALKTAESGYLTRRLIDVAQDVIVYAEDCGTTAGIWIEQGERGVMSVPIARRIAGRWTAAPFVDPATGEEVIGANEEITEAIAQRIGEVVGRIEDPSQRRVYVRSVLHCLSKRGVCRRCYGWSLATRKLVLLGEAVGIIAAESIGEPGTQLTMRTFHTGGVAGEDITQGLPRVDELFEAREPRDKAALSQIDGKVEIITEEGKGRTIRVTSTQTVEDTYVLPPGFVPLITSGAAVDAGAALAGPAAPTDGEGDESERIRARKAGTVLVQGDGLIVRYEDPDSRHYEVPLTARLRVEAGDMVQAGTQLTEGSIDPDDILEVLGSEAVARYLVDEVQRVYRSQGVPINDKHIEVVVRQMLRKVELETTGDTELLPRELVDRFVFEDINARVLAQDGEPATARTILLGVTKASLNTDSFLAAASFQETTRVLTEAAISGKKDRLLGLKENVIIGKLIPAGSGLVMRQRRLISEGVMDAADAALTLPSPEESGFAAVASVMDDAAMVGLHDVAQEDVQASGILNEEMFDAEDEPDAEDEAEAEE
jgi:DNA-directed RNA polymerase subunit beta'